MRTRIFPWTLLVCIALCRAASAAVMVDIGSTTISPAGTGTLDVLVSTDSSDAIASFQLQFLITSSLGTTSLLQFVNPQSDSQLADPTYVFAGNSGDQTYSIPVGNVSTTITPHDTFTGADFTADFSNQSLLAMQQLLFRLDLLHDLNGTPDPSTTIGHSFDVQVVAANSGFYDADANPVAFTSNSGEVTIAESSSNTPEPGTLVIWFILATACLYLRQRSVSVRRLHNPAAI